MRGSINYILAAHDLGLSTMAILDTVQQCGYGRMTIEVVEACINSCRENPRREYFEPDYAFRLIDYIRRNEEMEPEQLFHLLRNRGFPAASADEVAGAVEIFECINTVLETADKETVEWKRAVLTGYNFGFTIVEVHDWCRETKTLKQVRKVICEGLPSSESVRTGRDWDEIAQKFFLACYHLGMSFDDILLDLHVHGFDQKEFDLIFLHEIMKAERLIDEFRVVRDGTILTWTSPENQDFLPVGAVHPAGTQVEEREMEEVFKENGLPDGEGGGHKLRRVRRYSR